MSTPGTLYLKSKQTEYNVLKYELLDTNLLLDTNFFDTYSIKILSQFCTVT